MGEFKLTLEVVLEAALVELDENLFGLARVACVL
jgi:hypothetical protein